ncbi:hypothetical protein [Nocardioides panaciterrulae]|uniref:Uncharacterized protein n=1 Tax=Nocardioides panaciterrulae TaxID=661492 RepID=A0A7Y9E2R0_9ACTN|nr:hypothetical protein [Nocardioides panaciterrulae]NYD40034.1 hypothetical protein [Nocardioides panaciterrulae]
MIGRRRRKERNPAPAPKDRSAITKAELEAFIDQSRWLIEYHDKRGDSFTTRATALLGFSGVILVLLLRGPLPEGVELTTSLKVAGITTVVLLLMCALFCLLTVLPGPTTAPGVDEHRERWKRWLAKEGRGKVLGDIADSYLMAHDAQDGFPVGDAYTRADRRAGFFITAAAAMLVSLISLAVLLFLIYQQTAA